MGFIVYVATDVGHGKINTGVEFDERPKTLRDLVLVAEQLYSKEKQMQLNDSNAVFQCVSVHLKKISTSPESWQEIQEIKSVENKSQLFLFDWKSAPPKSGQKREVGGSIPPVQFTVKARQLKSAFPKDTAGGGADGAESVKTEGDSSSADDAFFSQPRDRPPAATANRPFRAPSNVNSTAASNPPPQRSTGEVYTPRAEGASALRRQPSAQLGGGAGSSQAPPHSQPQSAPPPQAAPASSGGGQQHGGNPPAQLVSQLPQEALDFLFQQLCRVSRENDNKLRSGPLAISTQRLHTICMENEMALSTETFSVMVHHKTYLEYTDWHTLVDEYGPVVDALYDRLCNKDDHPVTKRVKNDLSRLKATIHSLEDEEQDLIARQARLKQELLDARRRLREAEDMLQKEEVISKPDRTKETAMLTKFVDLRTRQVKLQDEEARVNHELSLL